MFKLKVKRKPIVNYKIDIGMKFKMRKLEEIRTLIRKDCEPIETECQFYIDDKGSGWSGIYLNDKFNDPESGYEFLGYD